MDGEVSTLLSVSTFNHEIVAISCLQGHDVLEATIKYNGATLHSQRLQGQGLTAQQCSEWHHVTVSTAFLLWNF